MYLPNELIVAILGHLERKHLKSARLVCKIWCSYASGILFDRVYIAPNKVDLEVFEAITQHPVLSKCVRHLIYDCSEFHPDLTEEEYVDRLWEQTAVVFDLKEPGRCNLNSHIYTEPHIIGWIKDVAKNDLLAAIYTKWKDHDFISRGYQMYGEHGDYQRNSILSGDFMETLVQGLSRFVCLKTVSLEVGWPSLVSPGLDQNCHGTPLARRWDPLHYGPQRWGFWELPAEMENRLGVVRHYWFVNTALLRTQRHVDEISIGKNSLDGMPSRVFEIHNDLRPDITRMDFAVMSGIKRLYLNIESDNVRYNIRGLPKLLESMHLLQQLELRFHGFWEPSRFTHRQVFPQAMTWNNLEEFSLSRCTSSATKLLRLLLIQMPGLKHMEFGSMTLTEGRWETVFEGLKQSNRSTIYKFRNDAILRHNGRGALRLERLAINEYLMHGGRHPCFADG